MSLRSSFATSSLVLALSLPGGAQIPAADQVKIQFPNNGAQWRALKPAFNTGAADCTGPIPDPACDECPDGEELEWHAGPNHPWGFPNCQNLNQDWANLQWLSVGHIDDDEHLDYLVVMSQRYVLAFGLDSYEADGKPSPTAQPYVIWAWFDPDTTFYKHDLARDQGFIADFDGDGQNEVAVVVGPPKNLTGYDEVDVFASEHSAYISPNDPLTQKRLMIFGVDDTPATDPNFEDQPLPEILGWTWINVPGCDPGWSGDQFGAGLEPGPGNFEGGSTVHLAVAQVASGNDGFEILMHDGGQGRPKVLSWDGAELDVLYCQGFGPAGEVQAELAAFNHDILAMDLDANGSDELIAMGIIDPLTGDSWYVDGVPEIDDCFDSFTYNHADAIAPLDMDGDGLFEHLYVVQDCYDVLIEIDPTDLDDPYISSIQNDGGTLICEQPYNSGTGLYNPYVHGQAITVAQLYPGIADPFGYTGKHLILTPKDSDLWSPGSGNWSSVVVNLQENAENELDEVTYNKDKTSNRQFNGPVQFNPPNFDWDGNRVTDEVHSQWGNFHTVYRLQDVPYVPEFCTPINQLYYQQSWLALAQWEANAGGNLNSSTFRNVDVFGDYRDEVVVLGGSGLTILYNSASNPREHRHLSGWATDANGVYLDEEYVRRQAGPHNRILDYQGMMTFESLAVEPNTEAALPGSQVTYTALATYTNSDGNEYVRDVTDLVTWETGDAAVASFVGSSSVLDVHTEGYARIRAILPGAAEGLTPTDAVSENPAIVVGTTSNDPIVLYAGWGPSYLVADEPSAWTIEVRVADLDDDELTVINYLDTQPYPIVQLPFGAATALDDGAFPDAVAGDGVYTYLDPDLDLAESEQYHKLWVSDDDATVVLHNLRVGTGGPTQTQGHPAATFASEVDGAGPIVRGTGFGPTKLQPNVPGTLTLMAWAPGESLDEIWPFALQNSQPLAAILRDDGTGGDQFAGDGLFTSSMTISIPAGSYGIDFLPIDLSGPFYGDLYPRLRVHGE